jgi:hypothetical protein
MTEVKKVSIKEVKGLLEEQGMRVTRQRYAKTSVRDYLLQIEPVELCQKYVAFYDTYRTKFEEVPAGAKHHHWWEGGLNEHCSEMIGIGLDMMELYPGDVNFTKSDVIISVFLHDFAKIESYRKITAEDRARNKKLLPNQVFTYKEGNPLVDEESATLLKLAKAGIAPTDEQWSAVLFAEGGYADACFGPHGRTKIGNYISSKNPLAVFLNILDMYSSQLLGRSIYQW